MSRECIFLNETGDVEISWDAKHDESVKAMIESKMAQGVSFFVVKKILGFPIKRKIKEQWGGGIDRKELSSRKISVGDEAIAELFSKGEINISRSGNQEYTATSRARNWQDVRDNSTIGVKHASGG